MGARPRVEFWRFSSRNQLGGIPVASTLARRDRILDLWAAGLTIDDIAYIMHVDADTVSKHLRRARTAGDARAILRQPEALRCAATEAAKLEIYQDHSA